MRSVRGHPLGCNTTKVDKVVSHEDSALFRRNAKVRFVGSSTQAKLLGMNRVETMILKIHGEPRTDIMVEVYSGGEPRDRHYCSSSGGNVSHV